MTTIKDLMRDMIHEYIKRDYKEEHGKNYEGTFDDDYLVNDLLDEYMGLIKERIVG